MVSPSLTGASIPITKVVVEEANRLSRFEFAPPRNFLLPAVVLVLSEHPGHGYSLVKELQAFHFGRVDRPAVYRALAQLEADGLVSSWDEAAKAGHARRMYTLTPRGEQVLRSWMGVIKEERDSLDRVLRRYQATGTIDAALAEVEGRWAGAIGQDWSPVSSTARLPQHRRATISDQSSFPPCDSNGSDPGGRRPGHCTRRYDVIADRSVVLVEARSSVGPISFGAIGVKGYVEAEVYDGRVEADPPPTAHVEIAVDGLQSGNRVYDAELLRRIDARRFPTVSLDLRKSVEIEAANRFRLDGDVTFHGVTKAVEGTVAVTVRPDGRLVVAGDQVFDIRDFDIPSPTVLMLRIYPDVRVQLHVEAEAL
jgi:PadR family transcriptional regulator PadR